MNSLKTDILRKKIPDLISDLPSSYIVVEIPFQHLYLATSFRPVRSYTISTSRFGIGNSEGSNKTPTGLHRICEKIGNGSPKGTIFKNRLDTGIIWQNGMNDDNLICTRILRLEGLEPGINKGEHIDSFLRYIYIHGTNREELIGTPLSHGCICMKNDDIIELFDFVGEGTVVYIDK